MKKECGDSIREKLRMNELKMRNGIMYFEQVHKEKKG
nr:MAG TPA: hypothetical protein [Caudoviricetes sp.]